MSDAHRGIESEVEDWFSKLAAEKTSQYEERYRSPHPYEAGAIALARAMDVLNWEVQTEPGGHAPYFRRLAEEVMLAEANVSREEDGFPWGEVYGYEIVLGFQIVKYRPKDADPDTRYWFVAVSEDTGHSFENESEALIFAALLSEGVTIDTARRLVYGLLRGFKGY